jgi:methyltransferase
MVALHTALFPACVLEVWGFNRPWTPGVGIPALTALGAAVAMRGWVLATLGRRWTTRVLYVPGDPLVTSGPFRWLRHPNYLVVRVEVAAIPLVHGAWVTALVFSAANALLLRTRVKAEEDLLHRAARLPEGGRP